MARENRLLLLEANPNSSGDAQVCSLHRTSYHCKEMDGCEPSSVCQTSVFPHKGKELDCFVVLLVLSMVPGTKLNLSQYLND